MNKITEKFDFNKIMEEEIKSFTSKPKLLLHACCAPCSTSVLERLVDSFDITIFFYNPNMDSEEEFEKRKNEIIRFVEKFNFNSNNIVKIVVVDYEHKDFLNAINGFEKEKEGGTRCEKCFKLRLIKTKEYAIQNNFDYFTTTLTVSPYKNALVINNIGRSLQNDNLKYLVSEFKKKDGYKRSIELSKEYSLYRQDYCGCEFSKNNWKIK